MFTEQERAVFPYWDGTAHVFGDPLAVHRGLSQALDGDPGRWLEEARSPDDAVSLPAVGRLVAAAREAFGMAPFDRTTGEGALEADCTRALYSFVEWLEKNAGRGGSCPTSALATAPPDCPAPSPSPITSGFG